MRQGIMIIVFMGLLLLMGCSKENNNGVGPEIGWFGPQDNQAIWFDVENCLAVKLACQQEVADSVCQSNGHALAVGYEEDVYWVGGEKVTYMTRVACRLTVD